MKRALESIEGLDLIEAEVSSIEVSDNAVRSVGLADGRVLDTPKVILTTGTFLSAVLHCGEDQTEGGRIGDGAAYALSDSLRDLGIQLGRLKTGTPPV